MRIDIQSDKHVLWGNDIKTDLFYWNWQRPQMHCWSLVQMEQVDVEDMRIDIQSDEHILWANNIETDTLYWNWQRPLQSMLRPMYPGQLHQIQRNLQNLVAIIDPGAVEGLR